jgi:hypothetical protein
MAELALDVRRVPVRFPSGPEGPVDAAFFLPPTDPRGAQGLLGRLNDADAFLPVSVSGGIRLWAKSAIAMFASVEPLEELSELESFQARPCALRVRLRGGALVTGTVYVVLPADRPRLLDFLNEKDRFFALATDSGVVVVNKDWIESVEPLDGV